MKLIASGLPGRLRVVVETNDLSWMFSTTPGVHHFFGVREVRLSKLAFVKTGDTEDLNTEDITGLFKRKAEPQTEVRGKQHRCQLRIVTCHRSCRHGSVSLELETTKSSPLLWPARNGTRALRQSRPEIVAADAVT
jgi:hypothetical protein